jgi:serine/threonine protein kinase
MDAKGRRQFTMGRCLGRGGFGEVYLAEMVSTGGLKSTVAVKVLRDDLGATSDAVLRLRDEGRLLARLNHPTILKVFDLILLAGRVALVSEYVDGADLEQLYVGEDRIGRRALLAAIARVASALDAACEAEGPEGPVRIVHRDLKPSNIRIGRHGEVRLLDFGIAHFDSSDREAKTASDVVVGSLPYMAPERFFDRMPHPAADVFGLGCTLFEGLIGERYFPSPHMRAISALALAPKRYTQHHIDQTARLEASEPGPVGRLVSSMLRLDPKARPTTADVATAAEDIADDLRGPTLATWCRDRTWAPPPHLEGALQGQLLTEDTLGLADPDAATKKLAPPQQLDADSTLDVLVGPSRLVPLTRRPAEGLVPKEAPHGSTSGDRPWAPALLTVGCAVVVLVALIIGLLTLVVGLTSLA